ncbi:MAG: class I SAM-dependent methyltransferase [Chitinophagaceae bacterium]|nr:class I SAM-dependent methyltransferase [Chitinophagaceae bacterium]
MNKYRHIRQEIDATAAFNKQSAVFDEEYAHNSIVNYKRNRVRDHILQFIRPGSNILELNAGTGEDAIYFARSGHKLHATDISQGMQDTLRKKVKQQNLEKNVSTELCSYTSLGKLKKRGPYDLIFSNFAGLNCTQELDKVLCEFEHLLKPHGIITLVMLPKFCLWETLLIFKGKFKTAFRRFFSSQGRRSHIEGKYFKCWYYNPGQITKILQKSFTVVNIEALCVVVPPSYIEHFAERHPRSYRYLKKKENILKSKWPWKYIGDYYIISLQKKN